MGGLSEGRGGEGRGGEGGGEVREGSLHTRCKQGREGKKEGVARERERESERERERERERGNV